VRSDQSDCRRFATGRFLLLWCLLVPLLLLSARQAFAEPQLTREEVRFDIASQPLADALVAYARIAGVEILIDDGIVAGRQSAAVSGTYHPAIALRQVVAMSDLDIRYVDHVTVTLVPHRAADGVSDRDDERYAPFTAALQAAFAQAMCAHEGLPSSPIRVVAQLWIGPAGKVVQSLLLGSTGDTERDTAITRRLDLLNVGRTPPADLPQPATMIFSPRNASDCIRRTGRVP
jgi:hypothetical protein